MVEISQLISDLHLLKQSDIKGFLEAILVECPSDVVWEDVTGGGLYLCENVLDLLSIPTTTRKPVTVESTIFDVCEKLEGGKHYAVALMNSDAGGDYYFIPATLFESIPTLVESYEISKA